MASSLQLRIYRASINRFARTIVIKSSADANAFNQKIANFSQLTGITVDETRPETWKYYLNLNGQYHASDTPMFVRSLDTLEEISFDKVTLQNHLATLREYYFGSTYYNALVARYPEQEFLIRGILNPIPLATAIAAPDYTILYFDKNEVEDVEINLIPELQYEINAFTQRWIVQDFVISNNLYHVVMMANLYAAIPAWVRSIRLANCKTYKAHSFHIWNYLESHGYLSTYKDFLTTEQSLWLYRNIRWVYANTGRKDTFKQLVDVILTKRNIPVGSYSLQLEHTALPTRLTSTARLALEPLNLLEYVSPEPIVRTIEDVVDKQLTQAKDNILERDSTISVATTRLARSLVSDLPTKVYESVMVDTAKEKTYLFEDVLVEHWVYLATQSRYVPVFFITNPYTGDAYTLTPKEAFTVWLYVINLYNGIELTIIPQIRATHVRRLTLPTVAEIRQGVVPDTISDSKIQQYLSEQYPIGTIISTEAFYDTCLELHKVMMSQHYRTTAASDARRRGSEQHVFQSFYEDSWCALADFEGQTYTEYLALRGINVSQLDRSDLGALAEQIVVRSTGADTKNIKSTAEIQGAMLRLMSQLGTYSSHYIQTINTSGILVNDGQVISLSNVGHYSKDHHWVPLEQHVFSIKESRQSFTGLLEIPIHLQPSSSVRSQSFLLDSQLEVDCVKSTVRYANLHIAPLTIDHLNYTPFTNTLQGKFGYIDLDPTADVLPLEGNPPYGSDPL